MANTSLNFWFEGNGPEHFYKFRGINDFTKSIITNGTLYFGCADSFNDPFDFLPNFTMKADRKSLEKYIKSTLQGVARSRRPNVAAQIIDSPRYPEHEKQAMAIAASTLEEVRKSSGLLCLSTRPDHILLWSHYADSHKGIALRFTPKKGDKYFERACKITYKRKREILNFVLHNTITLHKLALLTKADFWSYEEEWRIVLGPETVGPYKFPASALDGIILGAKISEAHERDIRSWVKDKGLDIEWLRAKANHKEFSLDIVSA